MKRTLKHEKKMYQLLYFRGRLSGLDMIAHRVAHVSVLSKETNGGLLWRIAHDCFPNRNRIDWRIK
jgi:hypothetical protein